MSRRGEYHDVAGVLAVAVEISADSHKAGVLTGSAAVGLQGAGGEACDGGQVLFEGLDDGHCALCLGYRGEGMQVAEFTPAERQHFCGRIEFHGAGAERNHAVGQGYVAALQLLDILCRRELFRADSENKSLNGARYEFFISPKFRRFALLSFAG